MLASCQWGPCLVSYNCNRAVALAAMEHETDNMDLEHGSPDDNNNQSDNNNKRIEVISTLFVDRTQNNVLLDRLRETEYEIAGLTGYRIKIVEKNGLKLEHLLVKRDP